MSSYLEAVAERVVIFDGAMGTNLQLAGLGADDYGGPELEGCPEVLCDTRPELIAGLHAAFFEAGVDVVETNSFGCSPITLAEYGIADRAEAPRQCLTALVSSHQGASACSSPHVRRTTPRPPRRSAAGRRHRARRESRLPPVLLP